VLQLLIQKKYDVKLANIVYEGELVNHTEVDYINYINEAIEYEKLDRTLPTLYVGWSFMKHCNPNNEIVQNANILYRKIITNELYWECSFLESKQSHVRGVENFVKIAPELYFMPKFKFTDLDPIFFQIKKIDDLFGILPKQIGFSYNYKDEIVYLLAENEIYGIDLKIYKYFAFDVEELLFKISQITEIAFLDYKGISYQQYYKILPDFQELKRYIIVFLSK
jgi:hypothetical protein